MAEYAQVVRLVIDGKNGYLFIDGSEFPYHIHADQIETVQNEGELPYVRFSVLAKRIEVVADMLSTPPDPQPSEELEPVTKPEGVSWYKGFQFVMDNSVTEPPEHVKALYQASADIDDDDPFLVREGSAWGWAESPDGRIVSAHPWGLFQSAFNGESFEVVRVSG